MATCSSGASRSAIVDHAHIAYTAREAEGEWVFAAVRRSLISVKDFKKVVNQGLRPEYLPVGTFEARHELGELDYNVYVRSL